MILMQRARGVNRVGCIKRAAEGDMTGEKGGLATRIQAVPVPFFRITNGAADELKSFMAAKTGTGTAGIRVTSPCVLLVFYQFIFVNIFSNSPLHGFLLYCRACPVSCIFWEMNDTSAKQESYGLGRSLLYCCGQFGGNIVNMVFVGWVWYFYTNKESGHPQYISYAIMGTALLGGRILDAIADPLIAYWSDNTRTRWGRRRPFLFVFSPLLVLTFVMLFWPPFPAGSTALKVYVVSLMGLMWIFFTAVMGPYLALYPEIISTPQERVRVSTLMAVGMLLATGFQGMVIAKMVDKNSLNWGYFNAAMFSGALALVFLYITAFTVREKPQYQTADSDEEKYGILQAFTWTLKNRAFVVYISASVFQYLGFAALVANIPYIVKLLMGESEGFVAVVNLIMLPGFVLSFFLVNFLTKKFEKAFLYKICLFLMALLMPILFFIGRYPLPVSPKVAGIMLMALISLPVAGNMVLPMAILADIADYDAKITGHRREGMFFGMQGFLQKLATGMAKFSAGLLFQYFGAETGHFLGLSLLGPMAGFFGLIAFIIFLYYPLDEKTKMLKGES